MLKVTIICVGKLKENYWREACAEYAKRMKRYADFSIVEVDEEKLPDNPSQAQIDNTVRKEGENLIRQVNLPDDAMLREPRRKDAPGGSGGGYFENGKMVIQKFAREGPRWTDRMSAMDSISRF